MKRLTKQLILVTALIISSFISQAQAPTIQWQKTYGGSSYEDGNSIQQTADGGYIAVGRTISSNGDVTGNHGGDDVWITKLSSTGALEWQKTLGGSGGDYGLSIAQTIDGGYIVAATTYSNDGDVTGNHGGTDSWIVKLNNVGSIEWQKTFGGLNDDLLMHIKQTNDGGYIAVGYTFSNDGDVTGNHGGFDIWVLKLSSIGVLEWQKILGGTGDELGEDIQQTSDLGYVVAGATRSNNGDVTGNHGDQDVWIVKLNNVGNIEWQKTFGGLKNDYVHSITQTIDGGYIAAGGTSSINGDVTASHGSFDVWIIKLSNIGVLEWQKALGGSSSDGAVSIKQTTDGGYIIAGNTFSNDGDVAGNHGARDYWIVKLNNTGNLLWQKTLGGSDDDVITDIQQTTDDGFIIAGYSGSTNGDVTGNQGGTDFWIVKLSTEPTPSAPSTTNWKRTLGGSDIDAAYCTQQTSDGGYIIAGEAASVNGNVTGNHGINDFWIVKLNAAGTIEWQKALGGSGFEKAFSIQQTFDGGYIVAGQTSSFDGDVTSNNGSNDFWVVKLTSSGTIQWQKTYGGSSFDAAFSIQQTFDGGYIVAGQAFLSGNYNGWVLKLNNVGTVEWQKTLGGSGTDYIVSIKQTTDGGYIAAGRTGSSDGDVTNYHGANDGWVVKLSSAGVLQWQKTLGGTALDEARNVIQANDGSYIIAGYTYSNNGDVTNNHGGKDAWIVKLSNTGNIIWQKTFGGSVDEKAESIQQTYDGGYVFAGSSSSINGDVTINKGDLDYWVVKINYKGVLQWEKSYGGSFQDDAYCIIQTKNKGFVVAGQAASNNGDVSGNHGGFGDFWILNLSAECYTTTSTTNEITCVSALPYYWNGLTFNATGSQTAYLSNAGGCDSFATLNLTVINALPNSTGASPMCIGSSITLSNAQSGGVWSSFNNRATVNPLTGVVTGASQGTAIIAYKYTVGGCNLTTTTSFAVNSLPSVPGIGYAAGTVNPQYGPGGTFCANKTFTVVGNPTGGVWSKTGVLSVGANSGIVNTGNNPGASTLTYTYTNINGCSNSRTIASNIAVCANRGLNGANNGQLTMDNEQWTIYPNPAKAFIRLNVNTLIGAGTIVVTDLYGKQVKTQSLSMEINTIDIASLAKGMYFVSMITSEGKKTKKLVVE